LRNFSGLPVEHRSTAGLIAIRTGMVFARAQNANCPRQMPGIDCLDKQICSAVWGSETAGAARNSGVLCAKVPAPLANPSRLAQDAAQGQHARRFRILQKYEKRRQDAQRFKLSCPLLGHYRSYIRSPSRSRHIFRFITFVTPLNLNKYFTTL